MRNYAPLFGVLSLGLTSLSCGAAAVPKPEAPDLRGAAHAPLASDAAAGVEAPELTTLLQTHWEWLMLRYPAWATTLGDHRNDDRLSDPSYAAELSDRQMRASFLHRARQLDATGLSPTDQLTLQLFIHELQVETELEACEESLWVLTAYDNPLRGYNHLPEEHPLDTAAQGQQLLRRYEQIGPGLKTHLDNLQLGQERGLTSSRLSLERALQLLGNQLGMPLEDWALVKPTQAERKNWSQAERKKFDDELRQIVSERIVPALENLRNTVAKSILPVARDAQHEGITALPNGGACYAAKIRYHTGLGKTAQELHELGLSEVSRINAEMQTLGEKVLGEAELSGTLKRLRTDEQLYFASSEQILEQAKRSLAAAKSRVPDYFGKLPPQDCIVRPIPPVEAPYSTIAYYRRPHYDGSKPGEFFVNTYKPETRPRFEAQVLTFHESIPGHHLQLGIAQTLGELPAFRKFGGTTAFVEGWALYSERLAGEIGLFADDLDVLGQLSYEAWRAARLVVDTGIHALGWSRKRAESFMEDHTALAINNIGNEVDRYISWPGQALAYKVGQLEILRLRELAKQRLGPRFQLSDFHDAILSNGALPPPVLANRIEAWLSQQLQ